MTGSIFALRRAVRSNGEAVVQRALGAPTLSQEEQALISRLCLYREVFQAGTPLCGQGKDVPARLITSGWACRQRCLPNGRRQIFGFLLPGDAVGLSLTLSPFDELSTYAVTQVECVDALMLRELLAAHDERHARLRSALDRMYRFQEQCLLDHVVRLGRQSAWERTCHFLLELHERSRMAGINDRDRFPMPLTQELLSDALGLSVVHLNRTLQQLKHERLIELKSGMVTILDAERMAAISSFSTREPYGRQSGLARSQHVREPGPSELSAE